jgi:mRNA interferase HigB
MRIIALSTLRTFWEKHPITEQPLKAWYADAKKSSWKSFHDIKQTYPSASIVGSDRVVFNIKGNDYRLIGLVRFRDGKIFIRFIGTHAEYNKIDARTI